MSPGAGRQAGRPGQAARRRRGWCGCASSTAARSSRRSLKFLSEAEQLGIVDALGAEPGDLLLVAAGTAPAGRPRARHAAASSSAARPCTRAGCSFLWVVDFPLFEALDDDGSPIPAHHPFTMPHPDDLELLAHGDGRGPARGPVAGLRPRAQRLGARLGQRADPPARRAAARSSRCSASPTRTAQARFGFLLDAFRYGAPPHAGFAFGIDRLAAILAGEENIREVIAFPKTQSGADPLTGAPTAIDPAQLKELGLRSCPKPEEVAARAR